MKDYFKRYSVDLDGHIVAVFDTIEEAQAWLNNSWWVAMATIWDHVSSESVYTEVRL